MSVACQMTPSLEDQDEIRPMDTRTILFGISLASVWLSSLGQCSVSAHSASQASVNVFFAFSPLLDAISGPGGWENRSRGGPTPGELFSTRARREQCKDELGGSQAGTTGEKLGLSPTEDPRLTEVLGVQPGLRSLPEL